MNVFFIRNNYSILSAENIIKNFESQEKNIAMITDLAVKRVKIKSFNQELWDGIEFEKIKGLQDLNNTNKYIRYFKKTYIFNEKINEFKSLFVAMNVKKVFISCPYGAFLEQLVYYAAKELNVEVNFFEEGLSLYPVLGNRHGEKKIHLLNYFLFFINPIHIIKYRKIYFSYNLYFHFKANLIYLSFKNAYKNENYKNIMPLKFIEKTSDKKNKTFSKNELLIWSPISDLGIKSRINIDIELELFGKIILNNKNVLVKFHPRNSQFFIEECKSRYEFQILKNYNEALKLEDFILDYSFVKIIGIISSSLFFADQFTETPVEVYLTDFANYSFVHKRFIKFVEKNFPKITVI